MTAQQTNSADSRRGGFQKIATRHWRLRIRVVWLVHDLVFLLKFFLAANFTRGDSIDPQLIGMAQPNLFERRSSSN